MGTTTETVCPSESQMYCNALFIAANITYCITNNYNRKSFYEIFVITRSRFAIAPHIPQNPDFSQAKKNIHKERKKGSLFDT
jgi:hypothetical protein